MPVLPAEDVAYLERRGYRYKAELENGFVCLIIYGYVLPCGYTSSTVDLLLRLAAGWPDAKPDMFWMDPAVGYAKGGGPGQAQVRETYLGRSWQRFSRHLPDGLWRTGDGLETWMTQIAETLRREVPA